MGGWTGLNLKGFRNILITWTLAGLWHGADWRYVIFGLMMVPALIVPNGVSGYQDSEPMYKPEPQRRLAPQSTLLAEILTAS